MKRPIGLAATAAAALLTPLAASQEVVTVGGSGGLACSNTNDPPTLDDGATLASGDVSFDFDPVADELTVVVSNTSPVIAGPNPLITDVWFNLPFGAVDSLTLLSQTDGDGGTTGFLVSVDTDLFDGSNPNGAGCLGAFGVHLSNGSGIHRAIANPAASSWSPSEVVLGPVTFRFAVAGPGVGTLTSDAFASSFSKNPPGPSTINVGLKFQGGGDDDASDKLANAPACEAGAWMNGDPSIGSTVQFVMNGAAGCHGCLLLSPDPGPTEVSGVTFPLGVPVVAIIAAISLPPEAIVTADVLIPDDPSFIGVTLYGAVAMIAPDGTLTSSEGFSVTIQG